MYWDQMSIYGHGLNVSCGYEILQALMHISIVFCFFGSGEKQGHGLISDIRAQKYLQNSNTGTCTFSPYYKRWKRINSVPFDEKSSSRQTKMVSLQSYQCGWIITVMIYIIYFFPLGKFSTFPPPVTVYMILICLANFRESVYGHLVFL